MKTYDYCIWDFNGTLLDDVGAGISSVNTLLSERGLPVIPSVDYYRGIFRFPIIEYYKSLGFDFDSEPYEELAPKWVKLYLENVCSSELFGDVLSTLEYMKGRGIKQIILSATEREMLKGQLDFLGITDYFEEILGLDNIHAGSKLSLAQDWKARHEGARAFLIGDTDHDAQSAKALDADCVLVCRGHQSRKHLLTLGCPVFNTLVEVKAWLEN